MGLRYPFGPGTPPPLVLCISKGCLGYRSEATWPIAKSQGFFVFFFYKTSRSPSLFDSLGGLWMSSGGISFWAWCKLVRLNVSQDIKEKDLNIGVDHSQCLSLTYHQRLKKIPQPCSQACAQGRGALPLWSGFQSCWDGFVCLWFVCFVVLSRPKIGTVLLLCDGLFGSKLKTQRWNQAPSNPSVERGPCSSPCQIFRRPGTFAADGALYNWGRRVTISAILWLFCWILSWPAHRFFLILLLGRNKVSEGGL